MPVVISGTNGVSGVDGTASNPSYEGTDANTGVFFPAADTIAFATAGTEDMRIDTSGNVGIGTSSPLSRLHVQETTAAAITLVATGAWSSKIETTSSGNLIFYNDRNTERARFNPTGAFVFAGGDTAANGIGITFPATQSASSNANTLDDYEEGTWTPTITGTTTSPTVTYDKRNGYYTKVGRLVTITFRIQTTGNTGGSGLAQITGLPFTNQSATQAHAQINAISTMSIISGYNGGFVENNNAFVYLCKTNGDTFDITTLGTGLIYGTMTYFV